MAYTRIYENIYTFQVTSGVLNAGYKYYYDPMPELNNRKVKGISISNYLNILSGGGGGPLYSFFTTLIDKQGNTLCYNFPLVDLVDASWTSIYPTYKLRLFNIDNLDLKKSYYFFQAPVSFPPYENLFKINFYLE